MANIIHCGNYTRTNISRTNWRVKIVWGGYRKGCKSTPFGGMEGMATQVNIIHCGSLIKTNLSLINWRGKLHLYKSIPLCVIWRGTNINHTVREDM